MITETDNMSEDRKFRHVALEQVKVMLDFMAQHPDFASGTLRTLEARHQSKQLWTDLAKVLNNHRGARKTYDGWSKYWSDFKNKLKNKLVEKKRKKLGILKKDVKPFTKLEKQALAILGPNFEKKKYLRLKQNGFENAPCDPLPTEIKQESILETALLNHGHYKVINEAERLLGLESDHCAESSDDECVEDGDQSSDEPLLNSIYPKWLMEIEQKRADAELRRAKAEEQRAQVAVKTAESSLIQAEALKKLSEAAERQAEAMQRIAMALETRSGRSDDLMSLPSRHLSGYQ